MDTALFRSIVHDPNNKYQWNEQNDDLGKGYGVLST